MADSVYSSELPQHEAGVEIKERTTIQPNFHWPQIGGAVRAMTALVPIREHQNIPVQLTWPCGGRPNSLAEVQQHLSLS
jgi:hypothetical protein